MKIYKVFETIPYNVTGTELYYQNIDEAKDKLLELTLNYLDYILDELSVKREKRKKLEITEAITNKESFFFDWRGGEYIINIDSSFSDKIEVTIEEVDTTNSRLFTLRTIHVIG